MDNTAKLSFFHQNKVLLSLIVALVILIGFALLVIGLLGTGDKAEPSGRVNSTNQSDMAKQQTSALANGQTNPNIVGFGQTFECNARSDHEWYRTDQTLVIDPVDPQTMYVSVEYRGFHKSSDGGKTWRLLTNGIKAYGRSDDPNKPCYGEYPYALIDPKNSRRVLLVGSSGGGTLKDMNAYSGGIFESVDGGDSFKQMIDDNMNGYVSSVAFDPTDTTIFYYGTNSSPASYLEADPNNIFVKTGLVYQLKGGKWTELSTGFNPYTGATGVHVNPQNPNEIVVFTLSAPKPQGGSRSFDAPQMGVLRSTDQGKSWSATRPLPAGYEAVLVHAVAKTNFNNMFVTPFAASGSPKSFYSTDAGVTFTQSQRLMDYVAYDPHDLSGKRLLGYVWQNMSGPAVNKLFESRDAGATWQEFVNLPTEIKNVGDKKTLISSIVWHPTDKNTLFMSGASGLVWKSIDNGNSWEKLLDYTML